ncbi:MAG: hypothetical protein AAFO07_32260 [Bacteroidota bacterium]
MDRFNTGEDHQLNAFNQFCEEVEDMINPDLLQQDGFNDFANKIMQVFHDDGWEPTPYVAASIEIYWKIKHNQI